MYVLLVYKGQHLLFKCRKLMQILTNIYDILVNSKVGQFKNRIHEIHYIQIYKL